MPTPCLLLLPLELLEHIAWHIRGDYADFLAETGAADRRTQNDMWLFRQNRRDLSVYTRTCRTIWAAAAHVLYRSIEVVMRRPVWKFPSSPPANKASILMYFPSLIDKGRRPSWITVPKLPCAHKLPQQEPAGETVERAADLNPLMRTLELRPALADAVRIIVIQLPEYSASWGTLNSDIFACTFHLLALCKKLRVIYAPFLYGPSIPENTASTRDWYNCDNYRISKDGRLLSFDAALDLFLQRASFATPEYVVEVSHVLKRVHLHGKQYRRGQIAFFIRALTLCADFAEELQLTEVQRHCHPDDVWLCYMPNLPGGGKLRKLIFDKTDLLALPTSLGTRILRRLPALRVIEARDTKFFDVFSFQSLPPEVRMLALVNTSKHNRYGSPIRGALYACLDTQGSYVERIQATTAFPPGALNRIAARCVNRGIACSVDYLAVDGPPYEERFDVYLRPRS